MSLHRIRVYDVRFDGDVAIVMGVDLDNGARVSFHVAPRSGAAIAAAVEAATDDDALPIAEVDGTDLAGWPHTASREIELTEHAEVLHPDADPIEVIDVDGVPRDRR